MRKYVVSIEETIVEEFVVEANNQEEALSVATEKYRKGEFVLSPGEAQFKQMAVIEHDCGAVRWCEF